jgi:hypothetical protein
MGELSAHGDRGVGWAPVVLDRHLDVLVRDPLDGNLDKPLLLMYLYGAVVAELLRNYRET